MLDNYYKDLFGVIHQKKIDDFKKDYATQYNDYGEISNYMAYLRLGFIIALLQSYEDKSILDIGYGNGAFLNTAKNFFEKAYGYDISDYPVPEKCIKLNYKEVFSKIDYHYFDVITMFDSFEHFETLEIIKNLRCGYLIISVPNCKYGSDDNWFSNWKHRRPDEHLHHFDYNSLKNFVEYIGYELIKTSYFEDTIRKSSEENNILTMVFKR